MNTQYPPLSAEPSFGPVPAAVPTHVKSTFSGTVPECQQQSLVDARTAAFNGYVPVSYAWSGADPNHQLAVVYEYRPEQARASYAGPDGTASPAPGWVYVGFWRRVAAVFVDGLLLTLILGVVAGIALQSGLGSGDSSIFGPGTFVLDPTTHVMTMTPQGRLAMQQWLQAALIVELAFVVGMLAYRMLCWWRFGATLGQRALGIQVRRVQDGSRPTLWIAFLRNIGYLVSGWAFGIGFFWVAFDARKQGWHDHIAGTVVVRRVG